MKLLITGVSTRKYGDMVDKTFDEFKKLYPKNEYFELIRFGICSGIDADVRKIGRRYNINVYTYTYKAVYLFEKLIRNTVVLKKYKPNIVWIFCNKPTNWMGDLIKKANRRGISVNIFNYVEEDLQLDLFKDYDE